MVRQVRKHRCELPITDSESDQSPPCGDGGIGNTERLKSGEGLVIVEM